MSLKNHKGINTACNGEVCFFEVFQLWRKTLFSKIFWHTQCWTVWPFDFHLKKTVDSITVDSITVKCFFFLYHKDKLFWQLLFHCSSSWLLLIQIMGSSGTSNAIMLSGDTHSPCHKMMIIWSTIGSMPSHYNTMHLSLLSKLFWSGGSQTGVLVPPKREKVVFDGFHNFQSPIFGAKYFPCVRFDDKLPFSKKKKWTLNIE